MGQFASFAEILENKLRKEIEASVRAELHIESQPEQTIPMSFQPDVISLLLGRVARKEQIKGSQQSQAKHYHQYRPAQRPQPPPKPAHKLTESQSKAYQQFLSWGHSLADNFTSKDLKTAFRKQAMKAHPDQGGSDVEFYKLQESFHALNRVFN